MTFLLWLSREEYASLDTARMSIASQEALFVTMSFFFSLLSSSDLVTLEFEIDSSWASVSPYTLMIVIFFDMKLWVWRCFLFVLCCMESLTLSSREYLWCYCLDDSLYESFLSVSPVTFKCSPVNNLFIIIWAFHSAVSIFFPKTLARSAKFILFLIWNFFFSNSSVMEIRVAGDSS